MKKIKLTAVVSAYNAEKKLAKCLNSLKFCDELIVVHNSSTDNTESVAKKYTDSIFTRPNNPMLNVNKNFGITKASGEWVLYLDDDEQVTPELAKEIKEITSQKDAADGYLIPRKNIIFGKWIEHTGWYPDYQLRLFKKGKGKFAEIHVHELVSIDGLVGKL
ncbi:MAG TPA: glycosyltransferase family 2 protein, partial [Candidatus Saccharimonadales bacterium]|nr:glycosyltransferase family 2 protein [Candidatus Saccharimonadales bacterium]